MSTPPATPKLIITRYAFVVIMPPKKPADYEKSLYPAEQVQFGTPAPLQCSLTTNLTTFNYPETVLSGHKRKNLV